MRKPAYWSLICYPVALLCMAGTALAASLHHEITSAGFALLGIYMFVYQVIWAHFADHRRVTTCDALVLAGIAIGTIAILRLLVGGLSEMAGERLMLVAMGAPLLFHQLANVWDHFWPQTPATDSSTEQS